MNLADLFIDTYTDNEIKRICDYCLHACAMHEYREDGESPYGPCCDIDCDCRAYAFRATP